MAEVNSTDHLVRSEKDTLANGYDNEGYHPPKEDGEDEPANDDERLRVGAPDPVPNGHAHEETNGHVNGTAVIVLQEEDEEEEDTSNMDDHSSSQQKPLDTRLHHYIPVEDIDRKILNGSDVSIPEDAVISFSTGRVKVKKGGSSSPQSPRGDIPLETLPPSYGDQDDTRSEKAGLEAELNKNGVWSSAEGYNYGSAESQFVVSEKLNGTNNKSSGEDVNLPVSNHRKCLSREGSDSSISEHKPTGEKLYFNSDDSRKVCPNWKRLLICGAITIVLSVVILMCVFAATGIIYTKNTKYESGHSLPSVESIAHAGASWPRTSSKVPQKSQVDASPPNATSTAAREELDTVTRAPSTVSLKVPLLNDSSHSQTIVPNALVGEFTIIDENFTYDLNDNTSRGYMVLANNLETELRRIFRENGARFETIKILSFRPGSIKVKFVVIWNSDQGIIRSDRASEILAADLRQKNNSFYNFFTVDINSIHFLDVFDECRIQKGGCSFDCLWNYDTLTKTCSCPKNNYLLPDGKSCAPIPETSSTPTTSTTTATVPSSSQVVQFFSSETYSVTEAASTVSPSQSTSSLNPMPEVTTTNKPITTLSNPPEEKFSSTEKSYRGIFEIPERTTTEILQTVSSTISPESMSDLTTTEKYTEFNFETEKSTETDKGVSFIAETTTTSPLEFTESITNFETEAPIFPVTSDNFTTGMESRPFIPEKNESTFSFEEMTVPTEVPVSITTVESRTTKEPVTEFPFGRAENDSTLKFHIAEPTTEVYTFGSKNEYITELPIEEETTTQSVPTTLSDTEATETVQESTHSSTYNPTESSLSTFNPVVNNPSTYNPAVSSPSTYNPTTYYPTTYNPTAYNPTVYSPQTYKPTTYNPSTYNPTAYYPTTYNPSTYNPTTYNPATYNPTTYNPTAYSPSTYNPSTYNPTSYNPTAYNPSTYNPTSYYPSTYNPTVYSPSTYNPAVYSPTAYKPAVTNPTTYGEEKTTEYEAETTTTDALKKESDTTEASVAIYETVNQEGSLTKDQTYPTTFKDTTWESQTDSMTVNETFVYETTPSYDENLQSRPTVFPNLDFNKTELEEFNITEEISIKSTTPFFIPFFNQTPKIESDNFTKAKEEYDYFTTDMTESETHTETKTPYSDIFQPSLNLSSAFVTTSSPTIVQTTSATNFFISNLTTSGLETTDTSEEMTTWDDRIANFSSNGNATETIMIDKETTNFAGETTAGLMTEFTTLPSVTVEADANFSTDAVLTENVTSADLASESEITTTSYATGTVKPESTVNVPGFSDTEITETQYPNTQHIMTSPDTIIAETTMPYPKDIFTTKIDTTSTEPSPVHSILSVDQSTPATNFDKVETTYHSDQTTTMSTLDVFETTTESVTTPVPVSKPKTDNPFPVERNLTYVTAIVDGGDFKKIVNLSIVPVVAGSHNLTRTTMMPSVSKTESTTTKIVSPESFDTTYLGAEIGTTAPTPTKESSSIANKYDETTDLTSVAAFESNATTTRATFLGEELKTTTEHLNMDTISTTPYSFNTELPKEKATGTNITESETTIALSESSKTAVTSAIQNNTVTELVKPFTDGVFSTNQNYFTEASQTTLYTETPFSYKSFGNDSYKEITETTVEFDKSSVTTSLSFNNETKEANFTEVAEGTTIPVSAIDLNPDETELPNEAEVTTVAPYMFDNSTIPTTVDTEFDFNLTSSVNKSEENGTSEFGAFSPETFNATDGNYTFEDEGGNYTTTGFDGLINETTTNATTGIVCRDDQFICVPLNICLNNTFMCDGIQDCPDGVDEFNCQDSCGLNFRCSNTSNMCIMAEAHCDGIWDCDNGTDEENCTPTECAKHEVMCLDHSKCIRPSDICDNKYDCKDRSDEVGCVERTTCESGGRFFCNDGLCIPWSLKCDGEFDCKDKEDEANCTCLSDEFQCNDGKCLKSSSRCDGHRDCHDGGDEMGCVNVDAQHIVTTYEPYSGTWALLCAEDFNLDDGHYLCQELGFGHALKTDKIHVSFNGTWMAMRRDNLTDSSLWTERVAFVESCTSSLAAAVECQKFGCGEYPGLLHRRRKRDILGGSSSSSQWPFIGYTSTFSSNRGCLSEILTPIWLITSADCLLSISKEPFNGSDWYVRTNIGRDIEVGMAQNHEVLRIINHPHSSKFRSLVLRDYDVALIRLKHALVFVKDKIGAICPPEEQVPPGITCFSGVLGTQKPRAPPPTTLTINSLALQILDKKNCNSVEHYNNQINQRMLCTQSSEGHTICDNDEGTPLMCLTGINKWFLAGMLTYQRFCEVYSKHPAVFSNLYTMRKFIDQVTGQKQYEISYDSNMYVIVPPTTPSPTVPETTTLFTTTETTPTTEMESSTIPGTVTVFETTSYTGVVTGTAESDTFATEPVEGSITETTGAEIITEELRGEENYTTIPSMNFTNFGSVPEITTEGPVEGIKVKESSTTIGIETNLTTLSPFAFRVYQDGSTIAAPTKLDEMTTLKDQMEYDNVNTSSTISQEFGQIFNVSEIANKTHDAMIAMQSNETFSEYSTVTESMVTIIEKMTNVTETSPVDILATTIMSPIENSTTTDISETTVLSTDGVPVLSLTNETVFKAPERLTLTTLLPVSEGETLISEIETETTPTSISGFTVNGTTSNMKEITETTTQIPESSTLILKSARLESESTAYTESPSFMSSTESEISGTTLEKSVTYFDSETTEKPTESSYTGTTRSTFKLEEYGGFTQSPHMTEETLTPTSEIETSTPELVLETAFTTEKPFSINETSTLLSDLKITTPVSETGTLIFETDVETDGDLAIIAFNDSSGIIMEPLESIDELGNINSSKDYLTRSRKLDDTLGIPGIVYESSVTNNSETTIQTVTSAEESSTVRSDNLFASLVSSENHTNFTNIMERLIPGEMKNETYATLLPEFNKNDTVFKEDETTTSNPVTQFDKTFVPYINTTDGMQNYSIMEILTDEFPSSRKNFSENNKDICGTWEHPVNISNFNQTKFYNEWPALGYLQMISETNMCAASLISSQFVITSLNCLSIRDSELNPDKWAFISGLYDEDSLVDGQQNHLISKIIPFANASISVLFHEHNLALVKLKDQVVVSKYSQNVCLPEEVQPGKECYAAGWSKSSSGDDREKAFYSVPVDIIPKDQCNSTASYMTCFFHFPSQMDYGSPLFCLNENGRWELQGVLNFPNPCDMVQPAVYDGITSVQDWIMNTLINDAS
ncbi:Low-density lipoprotein receptor-like protein [Argiope bruennichi]|uniref:Low-density lipoprotein receptor-like protein n=1 Tax=Argiope bruennichi TaxID=94029 RepID=A0A8T0EA62_ARGBR|nr:Low-density lipoprotein receptor-like protein [Argiope bruennichi]